MNWEKTAFGSLLLTGIYGGLLLTQRCNGRGTTRVMVHLENARRWTVGIRPTFSASRSALSSKLTKVANFRATICKVEEEDYLLRRINGIEEPVVARANEARRAMMV